MPPEQIRRLDQCLDELLANVVHHGGEQAAASEVRLRLDVAQAGAQHEATMTLDDGGPPFDPLSHQTRPQPEDLDDMVPGGLGIMMVREFSDRLAYRYEEGRNRLDVTVAWPA
jgi:anti-sigma regulatory factor (Ser/Thr protein kinase)